jgi:hypothetical protein
LLYSLSIVVAWEKLDSVASWDSIFASEKVNHSRFWTWHKRNAARVAATFIG